MIGDKIKLLRIEKGLSQKELAKELLISTSALGMYEQKRRLPDIDIVVKLSNFFNVSTDYLLLDISKKNLSDDEIRWLNLFWEIPPSERIECIGFIKGYITHSEKSKNRSNMLADASNKEKKHA